MEAACCASSGTKELTASLPCFEQPIPKLESTKVDLSVSEDAEYVIVEYRPHNGSCKFNHVQQTTQRETAYPRKLLARTILPRYLTLARTGKRPSAEAVAQMLQPYVRKTLIPSTSALTLNLSAMLHQMASVSTGVRTRCALCTVWRCVLVC